MLKFYLVPVRKVGNRRGPKYFEWRLDPDPPPWTVPGPWAMMDYGFTLYALVVAPEISQSDHDVLVAYDDVFPFPDDLDSAVDQDIQAFFEDIHLPTDWLTPATTWRELLRQVAGMMQFNQRYGGISAAASGTGHSVFENADLDTRLRQMTDDEQTWFLATVESFGYDPNLVSTNARLRQLVKQAADYWAGRPFYLGGVEF